MLSLASSRFLKGVSNRWRVHHTAGFFAKFNEAHLGYANVPTSSLQVNSYFPTAKFLLPRKGWYEAAKMFLRDSDEFKQEFVFPPSVTNVSHFLRRSKYVRNVYEI